MKLAHIGRSFCLTGLLLMNAALVFAQQKSVESKTKAPALAVQVEPSQVKFTVQRTVLSYRFTVKNEAGETVFDSGSVSDAELFWKLADANGAALPSGLFLYELAIQETADSATQSQRGHFIIERAADRVWVTTQEPQGLSVSGSQISVAREGDTLTGGARGEGKRTSGTAVEGKQSKNDKAETNGKLSIDTGASGGTTGYIARWTSPTVLQDSVIFQDGTGRVGIGTTTPGDTFEVAGATNIGGSFVNGMNFVNTAGSGFRRSQFTMSVKDNTTTKGLFGFFADSSTNPTTNQQFTIHDWVANQSRLVINPTGNIGIGNTNPQAKLDIGGDIRSSALRQELTASSPNLINGFIGTGSGGATPGNRVTAGVVGASIGGGGFNGSLTFHTFGTITGDNTNRVTDWFGTVGGGFKNRAGNDFGFNDDASFATVGGGRENTADGIASTVGGGQLNIACCYGATVGGGYQNITGPSFYSTIGGGRENTASGYAATVSGGLLNSAGGEYSFAAGIRAKANHDGAFVWADSSATSSDFASTANNQFLIRATGGVGIGLNNPTSPLTVNGIIESKSGGIKFPDGSTQTVAASGSNFIQNSTSVQASSNFNISGNGLIGGNVGIGTTAPLSKLQVIGDLRTSTLRQELTTSSPNIINGFMGTGNTGVTPGNRVTAGVVGASIGGGGFNGNLSSAIGTFAGDNSNRVTDWFGTVGGGLKNRAGNDTATLDDTPFATVGGGYNNTASAIYSTVGGGSSNNASASFATVGGGYDNTASGSNATVGGGESNISNGIYSTVGGGESNTASGNNATVGGGFNNTATGGAATVSGGDGNTASGNYATVPGGLTNTALGAYGFAAGRRAQANHQGAFVWGDSTNADFASTANDQFLIRATGGVGIGTNSPSAPLYVQSDRNTAFDNTVTFRNTAIGPTNPSHVHWGTTGDWYIRSASTSGKVLLQDTGGTVGIGTAAPADKLHVAGEVRVNSCVKNSGGTAIAGTCASDRRYKRNITAFPSMLQQVARLQPVHYFWRSSEFPAQHFDDKQSYGLIAQDVEAVLPELVETNADGFKAVNYSKLPLVTLQAVKELKTENDALKQQNTQQQQLLQALQKRLEIVEQALVRKTAKAKRRN